MSEKYTQPAEATLPHLWPVIRWLKNGCDMADAITELELYERHIEKARAILALRPAQVPMTDEVFDLICNAIEAQAKATRHDARYGLLQEIGRIEP